MRLRREWELVAAHGALGGCVEEALGRTQVVDGAARALQPSAWNLDRFAFADEPCGWALFLKLFSLVLDPNGTGSVAG
jgi:hypothetical protein